MRAEIRSLGKPVKLTPTQGPREREVLGGGWGRQPDARTEGWALTKPVMMTGRLGTSYSARNWASVRPAAGRRGMVSFSSHSSCSSVVAQNQGWYSRSE